MPCLFLGIHFPGNHFPHFPMFGKQKENGSKETQFQSTGKIKRESRKVFSFLYSKENTFPFSVNFTEPKAPIKTVARGGPNPAFSCFLTVHVNCTVNYMLKILLKL